MAVKNKTMADKQQAAKAPETAGAAAPAAAAPAPQVKKPVKLAPPPPVAQPGLMDALMDNIQAIGIALAALLGGGAYVMSRRRKQQGDAKAKAETSMLGDPGLQAQPLIAETGGQSVDTNNSVFNSNFAPSASQLDTNEVDPVAEADVYIAYGRDAQAEEILKEALRTHPERHAVRLKLMEVYANRKDARSFEAQASELYAMSKGQGDEWAQAAALGLAIDPLNPLYASAGGDSTLVNARAAESDARAEAEREPQPEDFTSMFDAEPAAEPAAAPAAERYTASADFGGLDLDLSQDAATAAPAAAPVAALDNSMDFNFDSDITALPVMDEAPVPAPALAAAAAPTPATMAAESDADHFLDFDLGGLSFEPVTASTAPAIEMPGPADTPAIVSEAPVVPTAESAAEPFDFAFDLDPPVKAEPAAAQASTPADAPATAAADDFNMDFGLDLPASAIEDIEAAPARPVDPLAELDLMDFDLPATPAASQGAFATSTPSLTAADFAVPELPEGSASPAPAAQEFDLSGIDLDLIGGAGAKTAGPAEEEMSALHMEMDTKLDLAIAYQEIGDKEGARELLDEVIRGGSDDQVERASSMRALLV
jgi:pilus assembly protein FimV